MVLFIVSVGLSVTMGLMGFVNLAHGGFAMLGGYVIVLTMRNWGIGFVPALALGFVVIAGVSVAFERLLYSRLYRAAELDQVLFTIGLVFMMISTVTLVDRTREPAAHAAVVAAGTARSRHPALPHLQHLPHRRRHRDRDRPLARLRAHTHGRADPRRSRQPAHGGIARHQYRPPVHAHLRVRQRHGGDRRRPRRRIPRPQSAIPADLSRVLPDRGRRRWARPRHRRVLRIDHHRCA